MLRKRWLIWAIAGALAATAIAGGVVAATAARGGDKMANLGLACGSGAKAETLTEEVASTIGRSATEVCDAFAQAQNDARERSLQARLDGLVEKGRITQAQAGELRTWLAARPEWLPWGRFGKQGYGFASSVVARAAELLGVDEETLADAVKQAHSRALAEKVRARLDQLVEEGRLTQEQADELAERFTERMADSSHKSGWSKRGWGHGRHGRMKHGDSA